jgi:hypothetical protein
MPNPILNVKLIAIKVFAVGADANHGGPLMLAPALRQPGLRQHPQITSQLNNIEF